MKIVKPTCINATSKSNAVWMGCHGGKGDAPPLLQALATSAGTQIKGTHSHTHTQALATSAGTQIKGTHSHTHTQVLATSAGTQIKGTHSHTSDEMSTHTGLLMSTRLHTDTHTQVMR